MSPIGKFFTGFGAGAALVAGGILMLSSNRTARADDHAGSAAERGVATVATLGAGDTVVVYRSPTCGCCKAWEDHMRAAGYVVQSHETTEMSAVKAEHGVPAPLQSCHTALVGGYVIEGHVPAGDVARLLTERPDVAGLAAPGMPAGAPGMDVDGTVDVAYEIFAYDAEGGAEIWATRR